MSDSKKIVYSIIKFLKEELASLSPDAGESIEVAIECLANAYHIRNDDESLDIGTPLAKLFASHVASATATDEAKQPTAAEKEQAESLKSEGNNLMKAERFEEALQCYSKAIELDPFNAVYYCNRAAAHSRLNNHQASIEDCKTALKLEPSYSKAYGRLGLAYSSLNKFKEAKASFEKALVLEPGNETYMHNIEVNEENLKKSMNKGTRLPDLENLDMRALLEDPSLLESVASEFLRNQNVVNIFTPLLPGMDGENGGIEAIMRAGRIMLQRLENSNPELLEELRQQMTNAAAAAAATDPSKLKKE